MRYTYKTGLLETVRCDRDNYAGFIRSYSMKLFVPGVKREPIVHAKLTFGNNVA